MNRAAPQSPQPPLSPIFLVYSEGQERVEEGRGSLLASHAAGQDSLSACEEGWGEVPDGRLGLQPDVPFPTRVLDSLEEPA